jgi:hypothetical protein
VDVDEREYWITAKHIITGAKHPPFGTVDAKTVSLQILPQSNAKKEWVSVKFNVIDPGKDIDIVVLAPEKPLIVGPILSPRVTSHGTMLGGDCEFVGFPYGNGWATKIRQGEMTRMPFIKHCTISGLINSPAVVWVLDGINNEGFSGGPVVVHTGAAQQIIAVISGFQPEPIEVVPASEGRPNASPAPETPNAPESHPREVALANSWLHFLRIDMTSAIDAIKKNPIGPKRN